MTDEPKSTFSKLGRLHLHDLRHTAVGQAVMSGENLPLFGKLVGNRLHRTAAGYAHLVADDHLVGAEEKIGKLIPETMRSLPHQMLQLPPHATYVQISARSPNKESDSARWKH